VSIFAALFSLLLPKAEPVAIEPDPTAEALARIQAAPDFSTLQDELYRLPALPIEGWKQCQAAVESRMNALTAERAGMM
jgi:hypothetical protein